MNPDRIEISRYVLRPKTRLGTLGGSRDRPGFLIRFWFEGIGPGYGDCHPWPELGQAGIEDHIDDLSQRRWTPLLRSSRDFAWVDAQARAQGVSLFEGVRIPRSHALFTDVRELFARFDGGWLRAQGYASLKIKWSPQEGQRGIPDAEFLSVLKECRSKSLKVRLDFNAQFDEGGAQRVLEALQSFRDVIEFIEDPYAPVETWGEDQERFGIAFALDQVAFSTGDPLLEKPWVRVLKPAWNPGWCLEQVGDPRLVVTSAMDHPLGQVQAAWAASRLGVTRDAGLLTHLQYEPSIFSEALSSEGGVLLPPRGTGFGWDEHWETLDWRKLA